MISPSKSELLTVKQFTERFQVSRSTVFSWLKNGTLKEGIHYIRIGRVLRFYWPFLTDDQQSNESCKSFEKDNDLLQVRKKRGK